MDLNPYNEYPSDAPATDELNTHAGNPTPVEHHWFAGNDTVGKNGQARKRRARAVTIITTTLAAIIATIGVVTTNVTAANVDLFNVAATDTVVSFEVHLIGDDEKALSNVIPDLCIVLHNDFTNREYQLKAENALEKSTDVAAAQAETNGTGENTDGGAAGTTSGTDGTTKPKAVFTFVGTFEGLVPNMQYTVSVSQKAAIGRTTIATKKIRTELANRQGT